MRPALLVIRPARGWKSGNPGDKHIPGDSGETWGVLIAYQGEEIVGRYEGGGQLTVVINQYYQAVLSGMDLRQVSLPAMEIAGATTTV